MIETGGLRAWLSLGSNIDRQLNIKNALLDLRAEFGELVVSPIYESKAVGTAGITGAVVSK